MIASLHNTRSETSAESVRLWQAERKRKVIANLVTVVMLLWIFEGALRKWVLPSQANLLYFIRDPIVLLIYGYALINGMWPRQNIFLNIGLIFGLLGLTLAICQLVIGYGIDSPMSPVIIAIYGWRNYFYYIPFAFLIGEHLTHADLRRISSWILGLSIPMGLLVYAQFHSAPSSPINVGISENVANQFIGLGLDPEHTRPMGTFTSSLAVSLFIVFAFAMAIPRLIRGDGGRERSSRWLGLIGLIGAIMCVMYSGSRGAVLGVALEFVVTAALAILTIDKKQSLRLLGTTAVALVIALVLGLTWFRGGLDAFVNRWQAAYIYESTQFTGGVFGRAIYGFADFLRLILITPVLGVGLGAAGNASTLLGATINNAIPLAIAETDWARHMLDLGPIFGVLFITYRVALSVWLTRLVVNSRSLAAGATYSSVILLLLYGQITQQGSAIGFGWLTVGLTLAACRANNVKHTGESVGRPQEKRFANVMR
jgi:hypothetical protein